MRNLYSELTNSFELTTSGSDIDGSDINSIFNFFKQLHADFRGGWTNLQSHQQCFKLSLLPLSSSTINYLFIFLMPAILTGVRWRLSVVLICISLIAKDIFHGFIGHLYFFIWKLSIQFFCSFIDWIILLVFNFLHSLYILDINPLSDE
jgi:hypothetical protein